MEHVTTEPQSFSELNPPVNPERYPGGAWLVMRGLIVVQETEGLFQVKRADADKTAWVPKSLCRVMLREPFVWTPYPRTHNTAIDVDVRPRMYVELLAKLGD